MQSKRGLSGVITTLIIILLVIAAIGIIWAVVNPFIRESAEEISLAKFTLDLGITQAYFDGDNILIGVKRGAGEGDLVGLKFVISDGQNSIVVERASTLAQQEMETYTLTGIVWGDVVKDDVTEISVAPIYATTSGTAVTGEIVDTYVFGSGITGGLSGEGTPDCTPTNTCENLGYTECGTPDDGCGTPLNCGSCDAGFVCNVGICVEEEACESSCEILELECGTHEICGVDTICGDYGGGCAVGSECLEGVCLELVQLDGGLIDNVWPPGSGIYFDDDKLSKVDGLYYGAAVYFPVRDTTKCYLIVGYSYDASLYSNAIVELSLIEQLEIIPGDIYQIWESMVKCNDANEIL